MFKEIKNIVPSVIYLSGAGEIVRPPADADTASMVFLELGGYTIGFTSLTVEERVAVEALLNSQVIEYAQPIKAPDFIVATPDVEKDPVKAIAAAVAEARKGKGEEKSLGVIVLSLIEYIDDLEKRVKKLEGK